MAMTSWPPRWQGRRMMQPSASSHARWRQRSRARQRASKGAPASTPGCAQSRTRFAAWLVAPMTPGQLMAATLQVLANVRLAPPVH